MKKIIAVLIASVLMFSLGSCGERNGIWGMYKTEEENGNYESVEFAYSKSIYVADQSAVRDGGDDGDDGRDEGWYSKDGDTVTCRFTDEDENGTLIREMTFLYDAENDTLTLTKIKTETKNADGEKTEETTEYNKLFIKESEN